MSSRVGGVLKLIFGYPLEPVNRRQFISFTVRNVLLGASAGFLIWDQATRPAETRPASRTLGRNELLEQKVLGILGAVQKNRSMSPRYHVFTSKMIELIEKREIKFATAKNLGPSHRDFNAIYHPDTNTVEVDMADISSFNEVEFNALLIHELFHAYQHWRGMPMKKSRMEAEAYLAEVDYLYHNNHNIPDTWFAFITAPRAETLPQRFNVPISILEKVINVSFDSPQYKRAVETIGDNYIWSVLFRRFSEPDLQFSLLAESFRDAKFPEAELRSTWEKVRKDVIKEPASVFNLKIEQQAKITFLIVSAQFYERALWEAGKKTETASVINETLETFKSALRSTNLSKLDTIMKNRRVAKPVGH